MINSLCVEKIAINFALDKNVMCSHILSNIDAVSRFMINLMSSSYKDKLHTIYSKEDYAFLIKAHCAHKTSNIDLVKYFVDNGGNMPYNTQDLLIGVGDHSYVIGAI